MFEYYITTAGILLFIPVKSESLVENRNADLELLDYCAGLFTMCGEGSFFATNNHGFTCKSCQEACKEDTSPSCSALCKDNHAGFGDYHNYPIILLDNPMSKCLHHFNEACQSTRAFVTNGSVYRCLPMSNICEEGQWDETCNVFNDLDILRPKPPPKIAHVVDENYSKTYWKEYIAFFVVNLMLLVLLICAAVVIIVLIRKQRSAGSNTPSHELEPLTQGLPNGHNGRIPQESECPSNYYSHNGHVESTQESHISQSPRIPTESDDVVQYEVSHVGSNGTMSGNGHFRSHDHELPVKTLPTGYRRHSAQNGTVEVRDPTEGAVCQSLNLNENHTASRESIRHVDAEHPVSQPSNEQAVMQGAERPADQLSVDQSVSNGLQQ